MSPRVSDEWIAEVIATGAVPSMNLVDAPTVCLDLRDARAEIERMRQEWENLRGTATPEAADLLERLEQQARRWYQADGTFIELDPDEVIARRKEAAVLLERQSWALRHISATADTLSPQEFINVCADGLGVDRHEYAGECNPNFSLVEARIELSQIDAAFARRPALADLRWRYQKAEKACAAAGRAEDQVHHLSRALAVAREALETFIAAPVTITRIEVDGIADEALSQMDAALGTPPTPENEK